MTKSYKAKEIEIVKASCNAEDMSIEDLGETIDQHNALKPVEMQHILVRKCNALEEHIRLVENTAEEYTIHDCYYLTSMCL